MRPTPSPKNAPILMPTRQHVLGRHPPQRALVGRQKRAFTEEIGHQLADAGFVHDLEQLEEHPWRVLRAERPHLPVELSGEARGSGSIVNPPRRIPTSIDRAVACLGGVEGAESSIDSR